MKNFILPLAVAFLLSLLLHSIFYGTLNHSLHKEKLDINSSTKKMKNKKGYTSIKYVRLQKPKPQKPVKKAAKPIQKKRKTITKSPLLKKVKTIKLPKTTNTPDLKKLFTLSKKEKEEEQQKIEEIRKEMRELQKLDKQTQQYIKLYGEQYFSFSKEQKRYLKQNLNIIGRITQRYLRYPTLSGRLGQHGMNIVEFTLHPNGDISDLMITDGSGYTMLDKNSIKTIELAYKDYPKPDKPTKIKIYVKYILY